MKYKARRKFSALALLSSRRHAICFRWLQFLCMHVRSHNLTRTQIPLADWNDVQEHEFQWRFISSRQSPISELMTVLLPSTACPSFWRIRSSKSLRKSGTSSNPAASTETKEFQTANRDSNRQNMPIKHITHFIGAKPVAIRQKIFNDTIEGNCWHKPNIIKDVQYVHTTYCLTNNAEVHHNSNKSRHSTVYAKTTNKNQSTSQKQVYSNHNSTSNITFWVSRWLSWWSAGTLSRQPDFDSWAIICPPSLSID